MKGQADTGANSKTVSGGFFRELGVNFFSYGMVGAFSNFISFLTVPFFTRVFNPTEYGILETIQMVVLVISLFGTLLLENSFLRFFFDRDEHPFRQQVFSTGLYALLPASIIITAIPALFPTASSRILFQSADYSLVVFFAVLRIPFKNLMAYCSTVFRAEFDRKGYALFHMSYIIVNVLASIVAAVVLRLGLTGLLAAQTGVAIVFAIISIHVSRRYLTRSFSPAMMKQMLSYSLPMVPASLSSYGQRYINRIFVLVLYSMYSMGIFSVASKIAMPLMLVAVSLRLAWVPYAFKTWQSPNSKQNFRLFFKLYVGFAGLFVVGIAFLGPELVLIISTKEYSQAGVLIGFIAMAFAVQGAGRLIGVGLSIKKKMGRLSLATIFGIVVASVSMTLLAGYLDLLGIAIGTLIGEIGGFMVLAVLVHRLLPGYFSFKIPGIIMGVTLLFLSSIIFLTHTHILVRLAIMAFYASSICLIYIALLPRGILSQGRDFVHRFLSPKRST